METRTGRQLSVSLGVESVSTESQTGESPMRRILGWAGVLMFLGMHVPVTSGDEPTRPTASATEANPAVPAAGHSLHGEAFDDGPRHHAVRMPGMGKIHFAVTTARPEAQEFVDQGVAQLHSFFYIEAERSFRQAAVIDPDCAMAYWGMAMANVNNAKRARGFLKEARQRDGSLTPREKLYLTALEGLFKEGAADKEHKQAFQDGLETIVQDFPGDIDGRAWLAMASWQNGASGSRQAIETVIESVLRVEPMHPGAHHYRIHLWDGNKPSQALSSAALYARTAPGIAHAWHMPGHTYTGLKRYADAAYQQEGSARVDHAYMMRDRVMPFEIHNYSHNNQWLVTSYSHIGRVHDAITVARNLVEQPRDPNRNGKNDGGSPQRNGRLRWAEVLTRYELWDELIAANESGALDWSDVPIERREKAYTLGLAYAAKGDQAGLARQIAVLKPLAAEESKTRPAAAASEATPKKTARPASAAAQGALAELEGYQLLAKGDVVAAFDRFAKATTMRPEALARAHLTARNFGFAEGTARQAVDKQPKQVPPLAALVEILHAVGKDDEARKAFRTLEPLARQADWDVPVFQRLAPIVAGWRTTTAGSEVNHVEPSTDDATIERIDLTTLGPLAWAPSPAEPLTALDTDDHNWVLADHKGRNLVVLFFLGGKCAHCMQQLTLFSKAVKELDALQADLVAVSTDDAADNRTLKANPDKIAFAMPILPDPKLDVFKRYNAHDDFEGQPLHAIYLIDARGEVRYRRISAEPFLDVDFIKGEIARVNRMVPPSLRIESQPEAADRGRNPSE
jgi:peroxiredoxin